MPLPEDLDSTDLIILVAIADHPNILTHRVESIVYLSRTQTQRRLNQLEERGLIVRKNSVPGQTYRYELSPDITSEEVQRANEQRLNARRDSVARESLKILLQGMRAISNQLDEIAGHIESIL